MSLVDSLLSAYNESGKWEAGSATGWGGEEDILVGECRKCAWHLNRWAFCEIDSIANAWIRQIFLPSPAASIKFLTWWTERKQKCTPKTPQQVSNTWMTVIICLFSKWRYHWGPGRLYSRNLEFILQLSSAEVKRLMTQHWNDTECGIMHPSVIDMLMVQHSSGATRWPEVWWLLPSASVQLYICTYHPVQLVKNSKIVVAGVVDGRLNWQVWCIWVLWLRCYYFVVSY